MDPPPLGLNAAPTRGNNWETEVDQKKKISDTAKRKWGKPYRALWGHPERESRALPSIICHDDTTAS